MSTASHRRDAGLTLVELIVVVTLVGMVAAVIGAAFVTILRTTPSTQYRIDDARSTRGLQTYLARDVASTPPQEIVSVADLDPGGFAISSTSLAVVDNCGQPTADTFLHMTWVDASSGVSYHAAYTINGNTVYRTTCSDAGPPATQRISGDVSSQHCDGWTTYAVLSAGFTSVDICLRSLAADTGLDAGGETQEILLSITSRNYVGP
jgi:prepilin-type N-terminal cleavage/methylation domain-containing protein